MVTREDHTGHPRKQTYETNRTLDYMFIARN